MKTLTTTSLIKATICVICITALLVLTSSNRVHGSQPTLPTLEAGVERVLND